MHYGALNSIGYLRDTALVLLAVSRLAAEAPGTPWTGRPGDLPEFSFGFGNDQFGIGENRDDFRTAQLNGTVRLPGDWILAADYSLFTRRGPRPWDSDLPGEEGRIDQASISVGRLFEIRRRSERFSTGFTSYGLGLRITGDLKGDHVQNNLHEVLNNDSVNLPYEDTRGVDATAWTSTAWHLTWPAGGSWLPDRYGIWLTGSALVSTAGQVDASLGAHGTLSRGRFALWAGVRQEVRAGRDPGPTLAAIADVETSPWFSLGVALGPMALEMGNNLEEGVGYGRLTLQRDEYGADPGMTPDDDFLGLMIGAQVDNFAISSSLIWSPSWLNQPGSNWRKGFVFSGSTGVVPESLPSNVLGEQRQVGLGFGTQLGTPLPWLHPYGLMGVAYRRELYRWEISTSRRDVTVDQVALTAEAGVHIDLSGVDERHRLGLLLGMQGWLPASTEAVDRTGERFTAMKSHLVLLAGLMASTRL